MGEDMDEIKRIPAEENEWYWLYKAGRDLWNEWAENLAFYIVGYDNKYTDIHQQFDAVDNFNARLKDKLRDKLGDSFNPEEFLRSLRKTINFSKLEWAEKANFEGFIFPYKTTFNDSVFRNGSSFKNATFQQDTEFKQVHFKTANWHTFVGAEFKKRALFHGAKFDSRVTFNEVRFNAGSLFINVEFNDLAYFQDTFFRRNANFTGAKTKDEIFFHNAIFNQSIRFYGNEVNDDSAQHEEIEKSYTEFEYIPDFSGCAIKGEFILTPSQLKNVKIRADDMYRWAKLKLEMSRLHLHEEEIFYFSKELEARKQGENSPFNTWLVQYYIRKCDCGLSIMKPAKSLFLFAAIMFAAYSIYLIDFNLAFYHALKGTFPFIPSERVIAICCNEESKKIDWLFSVIRTLHILLSTIFLFLIGLGIRNRLRIK